MKDADASNTRTLNVSSPANAEGSFEAVPYPAWATTVDHPANATQTSIWYDVAGQNYSDDLSLRYDVCSAIYKWLTVSTVRLAQDDPRDCSSTLEE